MLATLAGAMLSVVLHPMIGLPIAAGALAALTFTQRTRIAVVATFLGGALTTGLARSSIYVVVVPLIGVPVTARAPFVYAALAVGSLILVGPVTASLLRRRPMLETIFIVTVCLSVAQVAALASFAAGARMGIARYVSVAVNALVAQTGVGDQIVESLVAMWPGALFAMSGFTAMLVVAVAGMMGVRSGVKLRRVTPLGQLDLDPRAALLPIAAIALIAAGRLPVRIAPHLDVAGSNLLVIARWVFFMQGVAVFAGLYERAKLARPLRLFGYTLLGITEAFVPAVSLAGLADVWLNVRRLPRNPGDGVPHAEAPRPE